MFKFSKIIVKGNDARNFLQGQLTADIDNLDYLYDHEDDTGLAGLCNIKGRLEAVFWVRRLSNDEFHLYLPEEVGESIVSVLKKYLFRSKVALEYVSEIQEDFDAKLDVIPWITSTIQGKYVPQMISLDILKGVHPRKGCYIGQEIVTRLRDLGKNKKRLARFRVKNSSLVIGDKLMTNDGKIVGEVVSMNERVLLSVVDLINVREKLQFQENVELDLVWKSNDD